MPGHYAIPCECAPLQQLMASVSTANGSIPSPTHAILLLHLTSTIAKEKDPTNQFFKDAIAALVASQLAVTVIGAKIRCTEISNKDYPWQLTTDGTFLEFPSDPVAARSVLCLLELGRANLNGGTVTLPTYNNTATHAVSLTDLLSIGATW